MTNPTTTAAMTDSKTTMATTHTFNSSPPPTPRTSAPQSSSSTISSKTAQQFKTVSSCTRKNGTNPRTRTRNSRSPSQKLSPSSAPQASNITYGYCLSTWQLRRRRVMHRQIRSCSVWDRFSSCSMIVCYMCRHRGYCLIRGSWIICSCQDRCRNGMTRIDGNRGIMKLGLLCR